MQPLEGLDAAFLSLETPTTPLHVGAVLVLDPPEGARSLFSPSTRYAQIRRVIAQRLHLVGPLRQRALRVPLGLHHPVWVDDPDFELDDHLSRASLPSPGGRAELDAFVAAAMSRPLDPDRPLWEMFVVEGLEGDRTALIAKVHHAILDGVSGASILAAFLDLSPRARIVAGPTEPWDPAPLPGSARMLRYAASSLSHQPARVLTTLDAGVEAIADLGMHNRELLTRGESSPPAFFSAPRTSINGAVSNRKRFSSLSIPLDDAKLVRRVFGVHGERRAPGRGGRRSPSPAGGEGRGGRARPGGHGAGVHPPGGNGRRRRTGQSALGHAGVVGHRHGRSGAAAGCHRPLHRGGQGAGTTAPGTAGGGPGADRRSGAGLPGGPRRGRHQAVRPGPPALQRDGVGGQGPGLPALLRRQPGGGHVSRWARSPRAWG